MWPNLSRKMCPKELQTLSFWSGEDPWVGAKKPWESIREFDAQTPKMLAMSLRFFEKEHRKIRPNRFSGEGVLIGVHSATLNAQSFLNTALAVRISSSWGRPLKTDRTELGIEWYLRDFRTTFGCLSLREYWDLVLGGFRQWKNGQKWTNAVNNDVFKGFGMSEHWKHCKNQCFGLTLCRKTCRLRSVWRNTLQNHWKRTKCLFEGVCEKKKKKTCNSRCRRSWMGHLFGCRGYLKFPELAEDPRENTSAKRRCGGKRVPKRTAPHPPTA